MLEVIEDGNMVYQKYTAYDTNHDVYVRTKYNTTWYAWKKLFYEGDSGDSIADNTIDSSEIQDGTLTAADLADNSVASAEIVNGTIVDADVNAAAAIAGTKIYPNFGSQDITTTGNATLRSTYFSNLEPANLNADGHV